MTQSERSSRIELLKQLNTHSFPQRFDSGTEAQNDLITLKDMAVDGWIEANWTPFHTGSGVDFIQIERITPLGMEELERTIPQSQQLPINRIKPTNRIPAAFFSYVRFNDEHDDGRLTEFCERLGREVRAQTGDPFEIWQDRRSIGWGQQWRQRIEEGLEAATLLVVAITPSWFKSEACREEFTRFRELERSRGREDLVLPVVYIDSPHLNETNDPIAVDLRRRQLFHIDDLRNRRWINSNIGRRIEDMAVAIRDVLSRIVSESEHARRAAEAEQAITPEMYPFGLAIPGQPGFVRSPYSPDKITDVTGYPPRTMVRDPYTSFIFLVPDLSESDPRIAVGLPADPMNVGWVKGWGVYRIDPWHLFGVCASREHADQMKQRAGGDYVVGYGSHRLDSDDFIEATNGSGV